ncbi:MAG: hypothetical protein UT37_C0001G0005 [Parcubacteria group bacterium GW2011_GWA2_39_18]|nr:MAG: hypothetical protein UT37_C0001G0005 [Parcubacteria group bacterium GW2011_GWA2_39_18]
MTLGLFVVLFFGIKYSSSFKNEVVLKASDFGINSKTSASREVFKLPQIEKQAANLLRSVLPDLNKYNLSQSDIENISQTLNISATSTKTQVEGIKMLQSQITSFIFKDNPEIIELFNLSPINDKNIKIDNSKDTGEKYLSQVTYFLKNDLPENALPPQAILLIKAIQKNPEAFPDLDLKNIDLQDPATDKFLNLKLYIDSYKKLLADVRSLAVPKGLVDLHKQEILTLQVTVASLIAVDKYPENKLAPAFAFQAVSEASDRLNALLNNLKNSLKTQWTTNTQ